MKTRQMAQAMVSFAVPFLFFAFCGCAPDIEVDSNPMNTNNDGYETIDGIYRVHVYEAEDTCYPIISEEERIDTKSWLYVTVQEENEDGSYVVDLMLADLIWLDVDVAPDGTVEAEYDYYGIAMNYATGTLTSDEALFVIELEMIDWNGEVVCSVVYEVNGYPLFEREAPPDGFYKEALEDELNLNPFYN